MNSIVSIAALSTATAIPSSLGNADPDKGLVGLVDECIRVHSLCEEAGEVLTPLYRQFAEQKPERPAALRWNPGRTPIHIGHINERVGDTDRYRLWCDPVHIEERRNIPYMREEFIGTDAEWGYLPSGVPCPPEMRHLFATVPDEAQQSRFDTLLAAHDAYEAQVNAVRDELGIGAAEARDEALYKQFTDIEDQIARTPARSLEGLQAKARYIRYLHGGQVPDETENGQLILISIIRDLSSAPLIDERAISHAFPAPSSSDPIFAAIEAHRSALANHSGAVQVEYDLEKKLPREKRQSTLTVWEEKIVETDDPRWPSALRSRMDASNAMDDAAMAFFDIVPTTVPGASALLKYLAEKEAELFPDNLEDDDGESLSFGRAIAGHVGEALSGMQASV